MSVKAMYTQVVRFRVQRSGLKTANHFVLIGYDQQHVHKTVSPNGWKWPFQTVDWKVLEISIL